MKANYELEKRKYVLGFIAVGIVVVYLIRLFALQMLSEDFKREESSPTAMANCWYTTSLPMT